MPKSLPLKEWILKVRFDRDVRPWRHRSISLSFPFYLLLRAAAVVVGISVRVLLAISPSADRARPCPVIVLLFVQYPLDTPGPRCVCSRAVTRATMLHGAVYSLLHMCFTEVEGTAVNKSFSYSFNVILFISRSHQVLTLFPTDPLAYILYFVHSGVAQASGGICTYSRSNTPSSRHLSSPHASGSRASGLTMYTYGGRTHM